MTHSVFFRLLQVPIETKGEALAGQIAALNAGSPPLPWAGEGPGPALSIAEGLRAETFTLDPAAFAQIPGSPFAYWINAGILHCFADNDSVGVCLEAHLGVNTTDDFRFVRLFFEVPIDMIQTVWFPLAKGGGFEKFYGSFHLVLDWENRGQRLKAYIQSRGDSPSRNVRSESLYGRQGITYSSRTQKGLGFKALPADTLFTVKGPIITTRTGDQLLCWLAILNSIIVHFLVKCQMAFGSYEIGVIQRTPTPSLTDGAPCAALAALAHEAHDLQRDCDRTDETTHAFCLPSLIQHEAAPSLRLTNAGLDAESAAAQARLAFIQSQIDDIVFDLYGMNECDRALVRREMGGSQGDEALAETPTPEAEDAEEPSEEEPASSEDLPRRVQDLLMWCVGVALGRWDLRKALDPARLPALGGPFDPLPRCAPGALMGPDGLPLTASPAEYPLAIPWDGILVDDETHPSDIVRRVRAVLAALWGERADDIETEACAILEVKSLRDYFRDPRRFFAFHIKRYSKSRRRAPIYWLLQSERRNYAIWLYYHRIIPATPFVAGREYADAKEKLEATRLDELRAGLAGLKGSAQKYREREIERQEKLVAEVIAFRKALDRIALGGLPPDPNDGVLISIAPWRELVPWSEARRMWDALVAGQYPWSTMARQMRRKCLVSPSAK